MPFAQLVIGPPGSGKSTYCDGMHQFLTAVGRKCSVVNLDPANDHTSYPVALDVRDLVSLDSIMEDEQLGPNGSVLFALEDLELNFDWLEEGLKTLGDDYILFDCPGQVELFTHHASLRNIFYRLQKLGYRLVLMNLTDSYVITQPSTYISALLLALRSMLQIELPTLNVLTKIDNLINHPNLPFNLDFYTEVHDLSHLLPILDAEQASRSSSDQGSKEGAEGEEDPPQSKFAALNKAVVELVEEYGLVGFETLAVEDKTSMMTLLKAIDRTGGYAFGSEEGANDTVWQVAMRSDAVTMDARDVQERWLDRREELDEEERKAWAEEGKEAGGREPTGEPAETQVSKPRETQVANPPPRNGGAAANSDDEDMEDIEQMRAAVEKSGIKIVKKG
ncbi:uncharacterized protein BDZ99DRAFT_576343 [Mytilinidion resinicola]|uniref:GPN-loop GTPase 2 n=1 Tax=Mytilinidion resinicola TaxID=574789 RepID=A0A6A6Y3I3_9PEZI|nr:uncharacterized protein BDZ99DRAFT_576343 [Mytilinidion resinicola]KAF2803078.1 hypothetical protein BDZ99DRAFT_576343 [Mytilinidion resinicola]